MACQQVPEMYLMRRTLHCLDIGWRVSVSACACAFYCAACAWALPEYEHVHPLRSLSAWHGWEKVKRKDTWWKEIIKDIFAAEQSVFLVGLDSIHLQVHDSSPSRGFWVVSRHNRRHGGRVAGLYLYHFKHIFNVTMIWRPQELTDGMFAHQVSAWQTIQWMRDPQPIERAEAFPPFQCDYKVLHHFFATSCISNNVLKDISARHVNWSFKQALHRELAEHIHRWRPPAARGPHIPLGARFSNTGFHQKWHLGKIQQKCLTNEPTWKENTKRNTDLREIQRDIQIQREIQI